jgi:superfamily II DNA or RNA helicase
MLRDARPWQLEAIERWETEGLRGIVEVATGGGKTIFAELCYTLARKTRSELSLAVLVPTVALLDQWYVSLQEDMGATPADIAVIGGGKDAATDRHLNLCVINSARSESHRIWGENAMLVVDECHRAGSPANASALQGSYQCTLGLSATPERQYDAGMAEYVVPAIGPIIYSYGLAEAERDGVLSAFDLINVEVPLLPDEQSAYDSLTKQVARAMARADGDNDETVTVLLRKRARIYNSSETRIPATAALADRYRGSRLLIFHEAIDSAERIAALLSARHHSVTTYHSGLGASTRRENLRLFRRGVFDILVCCRALDEGINVPEVNVAIVAAATASQRQRIQRLGRVLRPSPGKTSATVVTLYSTDPEQERLQTEEARLDGVTHVQWMRIS